MFVSLVPSDSYAVGIVGTLGMMGIRSIVSPRCRYRAHCTALQFNDVRASPYSPLYPYSPASPSSAQKSRRLLTITNYSLLITLY